MQFFTSQISTTGRIINFQFTIGKSRFFLHLARLEQCKSSLRDAYPCKKFLD